VGRRRQNDHSPALKDLFANSNRKLTLKKHNELEEQKIEAELELVGHRAADTSQARQQFS
jgi:hypothetical protein